MLAVILLITKVGDSGGLLASLLVAEMTSMSEQQDMFQRYLKDRIKTITTQQQWTRFKQDLKDQSTVDPRVPGRVLPQPLALLLC